jgi:hypothetical protein
MRLSRALTGIMAAAIALSALGATPEPVEAAGDQFQDSVETTYELQPARGVVRVTHVITMKNKKASSSRSYSCTGYAYDPWYGWYAYNSTCTTRTNYYYYASSYYLEKDATNLKVKASSGKASLKKKKLSGNWRLWEIKYSPLYYGKSRVVTLTYDLPAGGPRSTAERRGTWGYAAFCAAGTSGDKGRVRVVVPEGFAFTQPTAMTTATANGKTTYTSAYLSSKPWGFYQCFSGVNPNGYTEETTQLPEGHAVVLAAWKGDEPWAEAVGAAVEQDLPRVADLLGVEGLPATITVSEELDRLAVGNPWLPAKATVMLGESVTDRATALDALTRIWFPTETFGRGWMQSGYIHWSEKTAGIGGVACSDPGESPGTGLERGLGRWLESNASSTPAALAAAAWQREASCWLVDQAAEAMGRDRMLDVLDLAGSGADPWAAADDPGPGDAALLSWQSWLDLVTERGLVPAGADPGLLDEALVRFGISTDPDLLAARQEALAAYHAYRDAHGAVPAFITSYMRSWDFAAAMNALTAANLALNTAGGVEAILPGVEVGGGPVEQAIAGAGDQADLDAAVTLAEKQVALAEDVAGAFELEAAPRDVLQQLGLAGTEPADHAPAVDAVEAVDEAVAGGEADRIRATIEGAKDVGTQRAGLAGGGVLGALLLVVLGVFLVRRRSRRSMAGSAVSVVALPATPSTPEPPDPLVMSERMVPPAPPDPPGPPAA